LVSADPADRNPFEPLATGEYPPYGEKPPVGPVIPFVGDHSRFLTHRGGGSKLYGFNSFVDPSKGIFTTDPLTGYERNVCYSPYAARVTVAINGRDSPRY
jgi:hypothetical protein